MSAVDVPGNPLEGRLVRLVAREPSEVEAQRRWFNDPAVIRFMQLRYPASRAEQERYLARVGQPSFASAHFTVVRKDRAEPIGRVQLMRGRAEERRAELGVAIGEAQARGGGYGTDTVRAICRFGFEMMNLHRIELHVTADHEAAVHVYEKVGFVQEARLRDRLFKHGRYYDRLTMGLLRGELRW